MANEIHYKFNFTEPAENLLYQSLIQEMQNMFGVDLYYLPLNAYSASDINVIFQEVKEKNYHKIYKMRMYMSDMTLMGGGGDILQRFGLTINDEVILYITRKEFIERMQGIYIDMSKGKINYQDIDDNSIRPKIADLIYIPNWESFFNIKFVEDKENMILGNNTSWKLICSKYTIDRSENILIGQTGIGDPLEAGAQTGMDEVVDFINDILPSKDERLDVNTNDWTQTGYDATTTEYKNDDYVKAAEEITDPNQEKSIFDQW